MDRKDIIRMAQEAEFEVGQIAFMGDNFIRFAALVAAHEEKECVKMCAVLRKMAIEEEREECAKICDDWPNGRDDVYSIGVAIRARGEK